MSLRFVRFCVVPCLIVFAAGCGQLAPSPIVPSPVAPSPVAPLAISVAVSPQATAITTGQTVQFVATATSDTTGVSWSATVRSIDTNGNYTARSGAQSTPATVTATSKKDPPK